MAGAIDAKVQRLKTLSFPVPSSIARKHRCLQLPKCNAPVSASPGLSQFFHPVAYLIRIFSSKFILPGSGSPAVNLC